MIDDNQLEELITSLEIAGHKLDTLQSKAVLTGGDKKLLDDSADIVRKTLDDLRIVEVRREIESHIDD